jgi:hypothetical protein
MPTQRSPVSRKPSHSAVFRGEMGGNFRLDFEDGNIDIAAPGAHMAGKGCCYIFKPPGDRRAEGGADPLGLAAR